jgi:hypothetical protein
MGVGWLPFRAIGPRRGASQLVWVFLARRRFGAKTSLMTVGFPWISLDFLGFPWILSSEMSLFNGLWANFAETFIRALLVSHEGQGGPNKLSFPRRGTTGLEATFYHSIASGNNTVTHISEFRNTAGLVILSGAFGANWIQLEPQSSLQANRGSRASRPKAQPRPLGYRH